VGVKIEREARVISDYLEVWRPAGRELLALARERVTIGKDPDNDVVIHHDRTVSRCHAVLQNLGVAWTVRDLGSRNGTRVNGVLLRSDRVLRDGDELRLGYSRLVYRGGDPARARAHDGTEGGPPAPELTQGERRVLLSLCRPLLGGDPFPQPGSIGQVATELGITAGAVKQHLHRLYDKFDIHGAGEGRARLANEAIRRGAVNLGDLRPPD
jgi:FHA domain-containing protein